MTGDTIGHYRVTAKLGEGGMGAVYQARDSKLDRDVAIKVLPLSFANDPQRKARFEREARVLASLNHPGIAAIYGVEDRALVMELVPGSTLADRIAQGPIPAEETLDIGCQIAEALEYAHERGVIHRDLKPANIKIDSADRVKILDFGLAKAVSDPALTSDDPDNSPTITGDTVAGAILGTPAYMAPEQARGKTVDKRADIWAFGVVLWEMLTGKRLFDGESTVDVLRNVLEQPIDLERVPQRFRKLLARCLERNPKDRLRDIGEARFLLREAPVEEPGGTVISAPLARLPWAIALVGISIAIGISFVHFRETAPEEHVVRSMVLPPEKTTFAFASNYGPMELSPNGRRMVFAATREDGKSQLWIRSLDAVAVQPLPGTEGGQFPFWSPDSLWVAFFAGGKLKKIDTRGGPPLELANAPSGRGGSWSEKGVIVFAPSTKDVLMRVSSSGGGSSPALAAEAAGISPRFPCFLPDAEHFLFEAYQRAGGGRRVNLVVGSLSSRTSKIVAEADSNALYAQGRLLYLRESTLMEQPFDAKALRTTAEAVPVTERLTRVLDPGSIGAFSVSATGMLAYQAGAIENTQQLTWFDRTGKPLGSIGEPRQFEDVEFSPDRKTLAAAVADANGSWDLWMYDVARAAATRFTFDPADDLNAVWSPDGRTIAFTSGRNGHLDLYRKAANGTGDEELLYSGEYDKHPTSWSPDGKFLLYLSFEAPLRNDLFMLPLTPERPGDPRKPVPLLQTKFNERFGQFSPDGHWVAFDSDEAERREIYVAPVSRPTEKHQISANGGIKPRWRQDGKEIFYQTPGGQLMAAEVRIHGDAVEVPAVHSLFGQFQANNGYYWDVSADGQRILAAVAIGTQKAPEPITLVENWAAALKKQ
jgi:Tol biopolymer transport system component